MMKIKILVVWVIALILTACATQPYIMPPLKYNGSVVHIKKKGYIFWQRGKELAGEVQTYQVGLIGGLIEMQDRKNNPSKYNLSYGKAEQASFITNFRDVLNQHAVFQDAEIITNPAEAKSGSVLIFVKFKSTRVTGLEHNYKIILTVEMTIKSGKSNYIRTYMAESDEGNFFNSKSFNEQLVEVSEKLIAQLMYGIKQWSMTKT